MPYQGCTVSLALNPAHEGLLSKLIVVDIAPSKGKISPDFGNYLKAMRKVQSGIDEGQVKTRKDAETILKEVEAVRLLFHEENGELNQAVGFRYQTMATNESSQIRRNVSAALANLVRQSRRGSRRNWGISIRGE